MCSYFLNPRAKLFMVCMFYALFFSANGQHASKLSISELHAQVETMVNFAPDSALVLLDMASQKIELVQDKELASQYWAENNLRKADAWLSINPEKSKSFLENAYYYYATHINNKKLAEIFCLKGQIIKLTGKQDKLARQKSLHYFDTALVYVHKANVPSLTSFIYYEKTICLQEDERWEESFENAVMALQQAELSKDSLSLATAYFLMGRTYTYFGFSNSSEKYLEKSISYGQGMNQLYAIMHIYADILLQNEKTELALEGYQQVLEICLEKGMLKKAIDMYTNIGQTQIKMADFESAETTFAAMNVLIESTQYMSASTLLFSAQIHSHRGHTSAAISDLHTFSQKYSNTIFRALSIDVFKDAADLFYKLGQQKESAMFYKKWGMLKDSLHSYTSKLQLSKLEKMYLKEREKNQEITQANKDLKQSRTQQSALGAMLIAVLLISLGIVYYIRMKSLKVNQALQVSIKEKQLEQLIETQEAEQQRLARELHDGIGQSLAALKMQLQFDDNPRASTITVKIVDDLCKEVRTLSHQMMPIALTENGLKSAVEQLIEQTFCNTNIDVDLVNHGLHARLPDNVEVHLYRILQELTYNILKHANATKVGVQFLQRDKHIILIVEDNGIGFDSKQAYSGMGIKNLYSRVASLSGTAKVQSDNQEGTYIRIAIPLISQNHKKTA